MRTQWGTATDRGCVRAINEDPVLAKAPVFLVADGMGGHDAGDIASAIVVEEFAALTGQAATTSDEVHDCIGRAAARIRETLTGLTAGTTVAGVAVAALEGEHYWLVFNVGDSRVYRLADGEFEQISVDHSVVQELVDRGSLSVRAAKIHPERHVITRAVGTSSSPEPDYWLLPVGAHDRFLICSDGLTTELSDDTIHGGLSAYPDPGEAATWLVAEALKAGGRDNVTVVVVDSAAGGDAGPEESALSATRDATYERQSSAPSQNPAQTPGDTPVPSSSGASEREVTQ